jgi:hypothetical protein
MVAQDKFDIIRDNEANPISISSESIGDGIPHINHQVINQHMRSFSIDPPSNQRELTPQHNTPHQAYNASLSLHSMIAAQNSNNTFLENLLAREVDKTDAREAVKAMTEELNISMEGYSHNFLNKPLTITSELQWRSPPHT